MQSRESGFTDLYDCFSKILSKNTNKSVIESLINSSCFNSFGYNKHTLIDNLDNLINYSTLTKEIDAEFVIKPDIELREEFKKEELLLYEKECFGFYLTTHPTSLYKAKIDEKYVNCDEIRNYFGKSINLVVLIEKIRVVKTKKNERMAFFLVNDETADIDLTLFPKQYNLYKDIEKGSVVLVNGNVQRRFDKYQVVVNTIKII